MITLKGKDLKIPASDKYIGIVGENKVTIRQFEITNESIFDYYFKLDLQNGTYKDIMALEKNVNDDKIILNWEVLKRNLQNAGILKVQLIAFENVEDDTPIWKSTINNFIVENAINSEEEYPDPLPSEFTQMEQRVTEKHTEVLAAAEQVGEDKTTVNTALNTFADTTYPNAVQAVTGEGTRQIGFVEGEGNNQIGFIETAGSQQVGNVMAEGNKQIGLVIAEGDTQVERVQTEGAAQVSLAEGYAQIASAKAQQATEERERIEDLDVYTKKETDNTFSNALIGTANGETIEIADVQPNTDFRSVVLKGETTEIGTGDKSPANPYTLVGVENAIITVTDGTSTDEYPITTPPLYSLPDGTRDYIEVDDVANTAKLYRNVGEVVFDGVTVGKKFTHTDSYRTGGYNYAYLFISVKSNSIPSCSHFLGSDVTYKKNNVWATDVLGLTISDTITGVVSTDTNANIVSKINIFLNQQYAAGTPVTILYKLATPTTSQLTPQTIPTYSPTTIISTDKGSLDVKYNRDINKVLADLQAQIIVLGGMI